MQIMCRAADATIASPQTLATTGAACPGCVCLSGGYFKWRGPPWLGGGSISGGIDWSSFTFTATFRTGSDDGLILHSHYSDAPVQGIITLEVFEGKLRASMSRCANQDPSNLMEAVSSVRVDDGADHAVRHVFRRTICTDLPLSSVQKISAFFLEKGFTGQVQICTCLVESLVSQK